MKRFLLRTTVLITIALCQMSCATLLMRKQTRQNLSINSNPIGTSVYLDGKYQGTTPLKITLINGVTTDDKLVKFNHTIEFKKEGYADKSVVFSPSRDNIYREKTKGVQLVGLIETVAGIALFTQVKSGGLFYVGWAAFWSGLTDLVGGGKIYKTNFSPVEVELETLESIRLAEEQRQKREMARIAEQNRLAEIERQNELKRIEEQNKRILDENIQMEENKRKFNSNKVHKAWKEGDRICLLDVGCYCHPATYHSYDCTKVSAFVEKTNADRSKYQVRIENIYGTNGIVHLDAAGIKYEIYGGISYRMGEIKWVNPTENDNWSWISCEN